MTAKLVRCPQCGASVEYRIDNPSRPFCSPRCKLIDLGAWAEERYSIAVVTDLHEGLNIEEVDETVRKPRSRDTSSPEN